MQEFIKVIKSTPEIEKNNSIQGILNLCILMEIFMGTIFILNKDKSVILQDTVYYTEGVQDQMLCKRNSIIF